MFFQKLLFLILFALMSSAFVFAQADSAMIMGKVVDGKNAAVASAVVTATNLKTKKSETATSGDSGNFNFDKLAAGDYEIRIEKNGFAVLTEKINLKTGELPAPIFVLQVAAVSETVRVEDQNNSYVVSEAATATKINVELRDVPQSIQVINRNLLEDRATFNFATAVTQNVSGVTRHTTDLTGSGSGDFLRLRGFSGSYNNNYLRDGLKFANYGATETADIERIEVLKGTSSVLYGRAEPGGIVNLVSKEPSPDNSVSFEMASGQFNFYRPQLDATGKVFGSDKLFYRFNAAYQYDGNFRDDAEGRRTFLAPVLFWKPASSVNIKFTGAFLREVRGADVGLLAVNNRPADVSIKRNYGEPFNRAFQQNRNGGVRGRYDFDSNWSVQSAYNLQLLDYSLFIAFPALFGGPPVAPDGRTVIRDLASTDYTERWHHSDSSVSGKFSTGRIKHNVVAGFEYGYQNGIYHHDYYFGNLLNPFGAAFPATDIFNQTPPLNFEFAQDYIRSVQDFRFPSYYRLRLRTVAGYAQDLITIVPQFKVLIGARYDNYNQRFLDEPTNETQRLTDKRVSPRVGFVYQPREFISFYASYGGSFSPQFPGQLTLDNRPFKPSTGEQFEAGAKFDALRGRLSATLAFFNLTFKDLLADDPNNPGRSVQTGKARSRGIELDVTANLVRGLNLTGNYAVTEANISEDTDPLLVGSFLPNTARQNGNLWATYRFDNSTGLRGFGFGAGLQATGRRFTNLANDAILPGFARLDATAFYEFAANEKTDLRFGVNLQNLTDGRYYESAFGFNNTVYPGAPVQALFSFKITRR